MTDSNRSAVEFKDKYLNEEHKVRTVLGEACLVMNHPSLQRVVLSNCGLSDDSVECIVQGLTKGEGAQLVHLDLSQNDFTQHSMQTLCAYLKCPASDKLKSLVLDRNVLYDGGLQLLAVGLFERY
jgi:Ran GTPase-activating protein (RanGAP) involved in mRNA processing and transport